MYFFPGIVVFVCDERACATLRQKELRFLCTENSIKSSENLRQPKKNHKIKETAEQKRKNNKIKSNRRKWVEKTTRTNIHVMCGFCTRFPTMSLYVSCFFLFVVIVVVVVVVVAQSRRFSRLLALPP